MLCTNRTNTHTETMLRLYTKFRGMHASRFFDSFLHINVSDPTRATPAATAKWSYRGMVHVDVAFSSAVF